MQRITRREHVAGRRRRSGGVVAIGLVIVGLSALPGAMVVTTSGAPPSSGPLRLTAAEAARRGLALGLTVHAAFGAPVLTASLPEAGEAPDPRQLLDVAGGGGMAAVADRIGPLATELIVARADGEQLRVPMAGLLGASFAEDGTWLAAIDGAGTLHHVSTVDGAVLHLADGPFIGDPVVTPAGDVLALAVSSVEAPYRSRLVRVSSSGEVGEPLTDDELVYSVTQLEDGSLAVVAHRPGGGSEVRRASNGTVTTLADLDPGAIHVAVSADGSQLAWEIADDGVYLRGAGGHVGRLGAGARPRFSPDGHAILVDRPDGPVAIELQTGREQPLDGTTAAFVRCDQGCGS
jgi:hypothetical protein